jgi:hypothetical protein
MRFCFDYDMYLRLLKRRPACRLDRYLVAFRQHAASKTSTISDVRHKEDRVLHDRFGRTKRPEWYLWAMQRWFKERDDMHIRWRRVLKRLKARPSPIPQWDRRPTKRGES